MQGNAENRLLPLLYIDDSPNDRALVEEAILLSGARFAFHGAEDLESAIPYFQSATKSKRRQPALILLDFDLGRHTAVDFLHWLRSKKKISSIPVVIFSASTEARSIAESYSTGANCFINKPRDLARLKIVVITLYQSFGECSKPALIHGLHEYQPDSRERADTRGLSPTGSTIQKA